MMGYIELKSGAQLSLLHPVANSARNIFAETVLVQLDFGDSEAPRSPMNGLQA